MNSLNSILIEGNLIKNTEIIDNDCYFEIESHRFKRNQKITTRFKIKTSGRLADSCKCYLASGRGVRIVGSLIQDSEKKILIQAEHIEFKSI